MNSRQKRTWIREISTEGGRRRKLNADRRFARREDMRVGKKHLWAGQWSKFIPMGYDEFYTPPHFNFRLPKPPIGQKLVFNAHFDDEDGKPVDWSKFEFDNVTLREVFPDGTKSEDLLGSGNLAERRIRPLLPLENADDASSQE